MSSIAGSGKNKMRFAIDEWRTRLFENPRLPDFRTKPARGISIYSQASIEKFLADAEGDKKRFLSQQGRNGGQAKHPDALQRETSRLVRRDPDITEPKLRALLTKERFPELIDDLRHDFFSFAHRAFVELNPQTSLSIAPHLEVIASKLEACRRGNIRRLVINLPPRQPRALRAQQKTIPVIGFLSGASPGPYAPFVAAFRQGLRSRTGRTVLRSLLVSA